MAARPRTGGVRGAEDVGVTDFEAGLLQEVKKSSSSPPGVEEPGVAVGSTIPSTTTLEGNLQECQ